MDSIALPSASLPATTMAVAATTVAVIIAITVTALASSSTIPIAASTTSAAVAVSALAATATLAASTTSFAAANLSAASAAACREAEVGDEGVLLPRPPPDRRPSTRTCNALLAALLSLGEIGSASRLLSLMEGGLAGRPNAYSLSLMMSGFSRSGMPSES